MNINIVTGFGPRTGTSFVMQKAKEKGLPISGDMFLEELTIKKHNPNGYWDLNPFMLPTLLNTNKLNNSICKVWPESLLFIDNKNIKNIVILSRKNKINQLKSMSKVLKDELELPINKIFYNNSNVSELLINSTINLLTWLKTNNSTNILYVHTEDLDNKIDNILSFLERDIKCH